MQLTKVAGGLIAGEARHPMQVPGAPPALPLLCYEAIFPDEVRDAGRARGLAVNLTNDGWFGLSSGPYQHFEQARLRAIEQGLPLVRAANTGISAVVDPLGRIVGSLPLGTEGLLDAPLPKAIAPTVYARFGDRSRRTCTGRCSRPRRPTPNLGLDSAAPAARCLSGLISSTIPAAP